MRCRLAGNAGYYEASKSTLEEVPAVRPRRRSGFWANKVDGITELRGRKCRPREEDDNPGRTTRTKHTSGQRSDKAGSEKTDRPSAGAACPGSTSYDRSLVCFFLFYRGCLVRTGALTGRRPTVPGTESMYSHPCDVSLRTRSTRGGTVCSNSPRKRRSARTYSNL